MSVSGVSPDCGSKVSCFQPERVHRVGVPPEVLVHITLLSPGMGEGLSMECRGAPPLLLPTTSGGFEWDGCPPCCLVFSMSCPLESPRAVGRLTAAGLLSRETLAML